MRILIIDNTIEPDCWGSENLRRLARLAPGATICVRRAPHGDLPASVRGFDRIVLSGSATPALEDAPWISELHRLVQETLDAGTPYLGVCYGHQTLARVLGGKPACRRGPTPEHGWTEIQITGDSPLLRGLPKSFYSFSSHFDEVDAPPARVRVVACSERCAVQSYQLEDRPVFGIQFHPEKDLAEAEKALAEWKKAKYRDVLRPTEGKKLYDPQVGEKIFTNFLGITTGAGQ